MRIHRINAFAESTISITVSKVSAYGASVIEFESYEPLFFYFLHQNISPSSLNVEAKKCLDIGHV